GLPLQGAFRSPRALLPICTRHFSICPLCAAHLLVSLPPDRRFSLCAAKSQRLCAPVEKSADEQRRNFHLGAQPRAPVFFLASTRDGAARRAHFGEHRRHAL